jgi:hypothetical protein
VTPYREVAQLCFMSKQIDRFLKEAAAVGQVKHQYAMLNHDVLPPQPVMAAIEWGLAKGAEAFLEQDRPAKTKEIYKALKRDHPDWPAGKKARIAEAANNKYEENKDKKDDDDDEKNGHALDDLFEKGAQGSIFDIPVPNAPKLNPKMQGAMDEARATLKSLPAHAAPSTGSFGAFNRARLANAADPAQRRAGQKLNRAIPRMANEEATSFGPTPGKPGSPAGGTQPKSNLKDYT